MNELSEQIYSYIQSQIATGVSPSIRDICRDLRIKSTSTVHKQIVMLEEAGLISRCDNARRSIIISHENRIDVPILGRVAAGVPITAIEDIEGYIAYSGYRCDPSELFGLQVQGESMINAGILDGDIIIVRKSPYARNSQIVVAMVEDEATVKTFYKENGHFRLQPENDDMEPFIFNEVTILGIVIACIRRYE